MVNVVFIILTGGNRREIQVPEIKYLLIRVMFESWTFNFWCLYSSVFWL